MFSLGQNAEFVWPTWIWAKSAWEMYSSSQSHGFLLKSMKFEWCFKKFQNVTHLYLNLEETSKHKYWTTELYWKLFGIKWNICYYFSCFVHFDDFTFTEFTAFWDWFLSLKVQTHLPFFCKLPNSGISIGICTIGNLVWGFITQIGFNCLCKFIVLTNRKCLH